VPRLASELLGDYLVVGTQLAPQLVFGVSAMCLVVFSLADITADNYEEALNWQKINCEYC